MDTLHKSVYDVAKAISALVPQGGPVLCRDEMEEWSASEASLFEEALEKYGKDFTDIQQDFVSPLEAQGPQSPQPHVGPSVRGSSRVLGGVCTPVCLRVSFVVRSPLASPCHVLDSCLPREPMGLEGG